MNLIRLKLYCQRQHLIYDPCWNTIQKYNEESTSTKLSTFDFLSRSKRGDNCLKIKIHPAGLEPATPCLEGRYRQCSKTAAIPHFDFQAVIKVLLKIVETCWVWRLWAATKLSTVTSRLEGAPRFFSDLYRVMTFERLGVELGSGHSFARETVIRHSTNSSLLLMS